MAPLLHYVAARDDWDVRGADTYPVGITEDIQVELQAPLALGHGDVFAVLSDGFLEAAGPDRDRFGIERTKAVIHAERHRSAGEILAALRAAVDEFARGEPQSDDRTAVDQAAVAQTLHGLVHERASATAPPATRVRNAGGASPIAVDRRAQ